MGNNNSTLEDPPSPSSPRPPSPPPPSNQPPSTRPSNLYKYLLYATLTLTGLAIALPSIISLIGFASTGPVLGSLAAAWQEVIGNVVAGSLFAFCQSAAMGGAAAGVVTGISVAGGILGGGVVLAMVMKKLREADVEDILMRVVRSAMQGISRMGGRSRGVGGSVLGGLMGAGRRLKGIKESLMGQGGKEA